MQDYKYTRVGVGVCIIKNNKVLLGKRKNSHGHGTWAFPGGHLEFGETPEQCATRELQEECGIKIVNMRRGPYTNDFFKKESRHFITIYIIADYKSGEPKLLEPDRCEGWEWFEWDNLPKPLFLTIKNLIKINFDPTKNKWRKIPSAGK